MEIDREFWRAVAAYMTDDKTVKALGLDTVYTPEIEREHDTGKACWCKRASKTLTYRLQDLARQHGRTGYAEWYIGVTPPAGWPTDLTVKLIVVDATVPRDRKFYGLHELAGPTVDPSMFVQEHAVMQ